MLAIDVSQSNLDTHIVPLAKRNLPVVPVVADLGNEMAVQAVIACGWNTGELPKSLDYGKERPLDLGGRKPSDRSYEVLADDV